jgi:hypothetical protein
LAIIQQSNDLERIPTIVVVLFLLLASNLFTL